MDFKKADKVFDWIERHGVAFSDAKKERGSALKDDTVWKYKATFHRIMSLVEIKTGKSDPMKVKPSDVYAVIGDLIKEYHGGKTANSSFLRGVDDALHAFKEASKASGVYKREIRLGDKRVISKTLNQEMVFRRARDTSVAPMDRADMEKVVAELEKSKSPVKEQAIQVMRLQFETGKRISAVLKSKVGDYDGKQQYTTYDDKGGKDNETFFLRPAAKDLLDAAVKGKKRGDDLFRVKYTQTKNPNKIGQQKSPEKARKQISNLIKRAAKTADIKLPDHMSYSSHSTRKGFAREQRKFYKTLTEPQVREELARRRKLDKDLDKRIDNCLQSIKNKFKNKERAAKRDFTHDEVIRLLVSTDINHSRLDVMRYYLMDFDFSKKK
ncbi:MAG: hypothetical protein ACQEWE_21585 [Bacillota bacterium]